MYKSDEVDPDLRNISPASFTKLENFLIEKIEYEVKLDELENDMKSIVILFRKETIFYSSL